MKPDRKTNESMVFHSQSSKMCFSLYNFDLFPFSSESGAQCIWESFNEQVFAFEFLLPEEKISPIMSKKRDDD